MNRMNHIETLKWFDEFYSKNEKLVHTILANDKKQMIEKQTIDITKLYNLEPPLEEPLMNIYQIKGYTRFDWNELHKFITTLDFAYKNGKISLVEVNSNAFPGIIEIDGKQYLSEKNLEMLRDTFDKLVSNLLYYKKYKGVD